MGARHIRRRGLASDGMLVKHAMSSEQVDAIWGPLFGHELDNPVLIKAVKLCEEAGVCSPDELQKSRFLDKAIETTQLAELAKFNGSRQVECYAPPSFLKAEKLALKSRSRADLSPPERRLLNRFLLRKVGYGTPVICLKCNAHRVSVYHLPLCSGVDLDSLCRSHDWMAAARALMLAFAECAPSNFNAIYGIPVHGRPPDPATAL